MRPRSLKAAVEHRKYVRFVAILAEISNACEVGPKISRVDHTYRGCTRWMDGLHHLQKRRDAPWRIMDISNVLRSCNTCNGWVEDHPELAHDAGLVTRPGDPHWQDSPKIVR